MSKRVDSTTQIADRELLFLNRDSVVAAGGDDMDQCLSTIEMAFRLLSEGKTICDWGGAPIHGSTLRWPEDPSDPRTPEKGPDKRHSVMPAYVGGEINKVGGKIYGSNPVNPERHGIPRSNHLIYLSDPESGWPLTVMDGTLISAMRTGAIAGLGARYLAQKNASSVGLIGAGVISRAALIAIDTALPNLTEVRVFDIDQDAAESFAKLLGDRLEIDVTPSDSLQAAVEDVDIVCSATSGPTDPSIEVDWLASDVCVVPLADVELDAPTYNTFDIYLDDQTNVYQFMKHADRANANGLRQALDDGTLSEDELTEMRTVVTEPEVVDRTNGTVLLNYGLPIEDVAWASCVYERALERGLGKSLTLFEEPHWILA